MYSKNRYDGIDPVIVAIIRKKAWELTRHKCFAKHDVEDLEQELMLHILTTISTYPPKNKYAFVTQAVSNHAINLIKAATSKKRGGNWKLLSLYEPVNSSDGEGELLLNTLPAETSFYNFINPSEQLDTSISVRNLLHRLPADLGQLCEMLQTMSVPDIVTATGMSRRSVYRSIERIKTYCEIAGLKFI